MFAYTIITCFCWSCFKFPCALSIVSTHLFLMTRNLHTIMTISERQCNQLLSQLCSLCLPYLWMSFLGMSQRLLKKATVSVIMSRFVFPEILDKLKMTITMVDKRKGLMA